MRPDDRPGLAGIVRGGAGRLQGEGDPLPAKVYFQNLDLYALVEAEDLAGVGDTAGREPADVDEAVVMDADVDEGAEGGEVGDDTGKNHAGTKVFETIDVFVEFEYLKFGTRVAAGLVQLGENVV